MKSDRKKMIQSICVSHCRFTLAQTRFNKIIELRKQMAFARLGL